MNKILDNYWVKIFIDDADLQYMVSESPDSLEFDIAEAISCFIHDYQEQDNPFYLYLNKLLRDNIFKPRPTLNTNNLEEVGKKIYDELSVNYKFYEDKFLEWYFDEEQKGNKVLENMSELELPTSLEQINRDINTTANGDIATYHFNTEHEMDNNEAMRYFFEKTGLPSTLIDGSYAEYSTTDNNDEYKYYFHMSGAGSMFEHIIEIEVKNKFTPDMRYDENVIYTKFEDFDKATNEFFGFGKKLTDEEKFQKALDNALPIYRRNYENHFDENKQKQFYDFVKNNGWEIPKFIKYINGNEFVDATVNVGSDILATNGSSRSHVANLTTENNEDESDIVDFDIPEWAVAPLINDDWSALNDEESLKLSKFLTATSMKYGNCAFYEGESDQPEFKHSNDIDNLGGDVYKMYIKQTKKLDKQF